MTQTNNDGENVASGQETPAVPPEATEQGQAAPKAVSIGFTDDGQFYVVKIPVEVGYHALLGWLDEAKDRLKGLEAMARRKMVEEKEKTKLVRPGFRGRFNLFK